MTNTTRELSLRNSDGLVILTFRTTHPSDAVHARDGNATYVLAVEDDDTVELLTAGDVEELHQMTYELLAGRKRDHRLPDARTFCGARHGERLVCILDLGHAWPAQLGPHGHIAADGTAFLVNTEDLPF